jgi:hypothetical protein
MRDPWSELGRTVACARGHHTRAGAHYVSIRVAMPLLATAALNSLN